MEGVQVMNKVTLTGVAGQPSQGTQPTVGLKVLLPSADSAEEKHLSQKGPDSHVSHLGLSPVARHPQCGIWRDL